MISTELDACMVATSILLLFFITEPLVGHILKEVKPSITYPMIKKYKIPVLKILNKPVPVTANKKP